MFCFYFLIYYMYNVFFFRLEEFKSKYYIVKSDNKNVWENYLDLKRKFEDKVNELENVNGKLDR